MRLAAYRTGRRVIQSFLCMATNFQGILILEVISSKSISRCLYIYIFTWSSLISVISLYSKSRSRILRIDQSLREGSRRTRKINIRWRERRKLQKAIKVSGENDFRGIKADTTLGICAELLTRSQRLSWGAAIELLWDGLEGLASDPFCCHD